MDQFYTYIWLVFKRNEWVPIYVGKGAGDRYLAHMKKKNHTGNSLRKYPHTFMKFDVGSEQEAFALEVALIAKFGRKNLGKGPLLNLTDGGEGCTGRVITDKTKEKLMTTWDDPELLARHSTAIALSWADPISRANHLVARNSSETKEKYAAAGRKNKGKKKDTIACPHCNKIGGVGVMKRYHFDNCKQKPPSI